MYWFLENVSTVYALFFKHIRLTANNFIIRT